MGGLGSGRSSGLGRSKVEDCRSIDVNTLHRDGCLSPGWAGTWQWTRNREEVAAVVMRAEDDRLHLSYCCRLAGGEWETVDEAVPIIRLPCRLGGSRPYFVCPGPLNGTACGRRVSKLYGPGRLSLCRHCYRLCHASQRESARERKLRRANKIRQSLGGDPGVLATLPPKPKGMWRRTYERLRNEAADAELRANEAFAPQVRRLLARIEHPKSKRSFWQ